MSKNLFNTVQMKAPGKNRFDLTHDVKLSCKMGQLVPVCIFDCVPGDSFNLGAEALIRFAPMVTPVMHRFNVSIHYFFVPNRILWDGWEEWITDPASERVFPYVRITQQAPPEETALADYLGLPVYQQGTYGGPDIKASALPFAAYQRIWSEYYRDQNLTTPFDESCVDGDNNVLFDSEGGFLLRRRAWQHDYFTSCLPFAQKGSQVDIPLGDVVLKPDWGGTPQFEEIGGVSGTGAIEQAFDTDYQITIGGGANAAAYNPDGTLSVAPTTITDLRRAFKLQEWLEIQARGGTRYTEQIRAQFNVVSSDARLQRPEYITGVKQPVIISEILNTTGTEELPQGNMAGHGIAAIRGRQGSYFCEEHGYIIGIMSIMPDTAYFQGVPRHFLKYVDQFDYYWPSFAHIGEQAVINQEVYARQWDEPEATETFGYVPRYAEYKFIQNRVAGQFKTTLLSWHLARYFTVAPTLSQEFIECDPSTRIFAVETGDNMFCHVLNRVSAVRPMPKYGNPYM